MVIRKSPREDRTLHRLLTTGAVLWVLAPLAIVAAVTVRAGGAQLEPNRTAWVAVEANGGQIGQLVDVVLERSDSAPVVAPAWNGTVQEVAVAPGGALASGDTVAVVDGVARLAWHTTRPFYRPLGLWDEGADVQELQSILHSLGLRSGEPGVLDRETRAGVRQLAELLGVAHAGRVESFDPGWVVYLAAPRVEATAVELIVGAPAPAPGTVIAETDDIVVRAWLADPASPDDAPVPMSGSDGQQLTIGGSTVTLDAEQDEVAAESLADVAALVADDAERVDARLVAAAERGQWVVPSAAVFATGAGTCVLVERQHGPRGIPVSVVGGAVGTAIVEGALRAADRVAVAPPAAERRCA